MEQTPGHGGTLGDPSVPKGSKLVHPWATPSATRPTWVQLPTNLIRQLCEIRPGRGVCVLGCAVGVPRAWHSLL